MTGPPDGLEQSLPVDKFARGSRETQQHFDGFGRQMVRTAAACYLSLQGLDEEIPEIEAL